MKQKKKKDDANELVHELFEALCLRYQGNLETLMGGSNIFGWFILTDVLKISWSNF